MSTGAANPLDYLYKMSTQRKIPPPVFNQMIEKGPPHMKTFVWQCNFMQITAEGEGRSKKEAKTAAARAIKESLNVDFLPPAVERKRKTGLNGNGASEGNSPSSVLNKPAKKKKRNDYARMMAKQFQKQNQFVHHQVFGSSSNGFSHFNPGGPPLPPFRPPPMLPPVMMPRMTPADHCVITKHKAIYPKDEELKVILKLVAHTEEALRKVSDILSGKTAEEIKPQEKSEEESIPKEGEEGKREDTRELMGVARVGDLAKGLLLSSERSVNVVALTKNKPTFSFLSKISSEVEKCLKEIAEEEKYQVHEFKEEGGFCVVYVKPDEDMPYAVNVSVTSSELSQDDTNGEENKTETTPKEETEESESPNVVPKSKRENALTELRRANWFSTMAASLPSCVECIRIIKDLSIKNPAWNHLSNWAIELLVERALFTAQQPLSPATSLIRVFEAISSGIFLPGGAGLKDPCEKDSVDAAGHLTAQQREDLTRSAHHFVRLTNFRQMYKVLGMEKPQKKNIKPKVKKTEETEEATTTTATPQAEAKEKNAS